MPGSRNSATETCKLWRCYNLAIYVQVPFLEDPMSDVTQILSQIEAGDPSAADQLLPLVYDELRRLAAVRMKNERPDHTLQATALVHEAYMRLVVSPQPWETRGHFFAAAANSMRQILVNSALARQSHKRGGGAERVDLEHLSIADRYDPDMILDLDEALSRLALEDPETAELVKLRFFAGLSVTDAGKALSLSRSAAARPGSLPRRGLKPRNWVSPKKSSKNSLDGFGSFPALSYVRQFGECILSFKKQAWEQFGKRFTSEFATPSH